MSAPILYEWRWLGLLISRCQVVAGRLAEGPSPATLISDLRGLTTALPDVLSLPEQLLVRSLLSRLLGRIMCLARLDTHSDVAHAFLAWEASTAPTGAFRHEWSRLLECCAAAMNEVEYREGSSDDTLGVCVRRVLEAIQTRYRDPALNLSAVAKDANLSPGHVARILKHRTGQGYVAHLRRARVSAAQRLLAQSPLSIKEIAAAVGYAHPNQLDRHFVHPPQEKMLDRSK